MTLGELRTFYLATTAAAAFSLLFPGCASQTDSKATPVSQQPQAAVPAPASDPPFDILVRGGRVIDGTGAPWFYGDVGVREGHIVAIGKLADHAAKEVIEAKGSMVTPGFIDMHAHSDLTLIRDGRGLSKIRQGVTTEVIGEGESVAPRKNEPTDKAQADWTTLAGGKADWTTLRGYFERLQRQGTSGNVMSYISAGQLRTYVMGPGARRRATPDELEQMKHLLAQGMEDGAAGLVMALETPGEDQYPPEGRESLSMPTTQDLIALAKVVASYGGIYANHMRDQGAHLVDGVRETALVGEQAQLPVEVFHIKAAGRPNFGLMPAALQAIHEARSRGIDIAADVYPYIAASHPLTVEVPRWSLEGGIQSFLARATDPQLRPRIKREVTKYMNTKYFNETTGAKGFDAVIVANVPRNAQQYVGKTISTIAREKHTAPDDEVLDLLVEEGGDVNIVMFYMSEKDMRLAMADPLISFDSDGSAISPEYGGRPHPRYYGTFPRVLGHYVREEHVLQLEDAVRKMTSLPAQRMKIMDRGILRTGMWADLVVFDPDRIIDKATFDEPHAFPEGISHVIVNGTTVIRNGEHTGALPGKPLFGHGRQQ
jgi:N-acyl-D-amino-acid deacylase